MNELAQIVNEILKDKTEEDIYALSLSNMQILEYLTYSSPHMLYDFDDFIKYLANEEQYQRFTACMEKRSSANMQHLIHTMQHYMEQEKSSVSPACRSSCPNPL